MSQQDFTARLKTVSSGEPLRVTNEKGALSVAQMAAMTSPARIKHLQSKAKQDGKQS